MGEPINKKTRDFIAYLVGKMAIPTKTGIIKMCYLCDLAAVKSGMKKITVFEYIRYYYGPFDKRIDDYLLDLVKAKDIIGEPVYGSGGGEYERFSLSKNRVSEDYVECLSEEERRVVDSILDSLGSLNAKMLTEVAYKTNPMVELGAKLGGIEHLTERLNLAA